MSIDRIAEERKQEITDEFDDLLEEGEDTDEAADAVALKYGLTRDDVHAIVREMRQKLTDEDR